MKWGAFFTAVLFLVSCSVSFAEESACSTETVYEDGGKSGVEMKLQLDQDRVIAISYSNFISNGEEGGAYFCSFEATPTDKKSVWTQNKDTQTVHLLEDAEGSSGPDEEQGSIFEISKLKTGYLLNFVRMSRWYCGFGAEYPSSVRIEKGKKECVVED
jgi:hypothetical protein